MMSHHHDPQPQLESEDVPVTSVVTGPLAGLRVLDLGTVYAAPMCAMFLGDFGADVIKVEHPAGDPARTHGVSKDGHGLWWKVIARNKQMMTLNLSTSAGQELLRDIVSDVDVVVENFRPGVLERWGIGPEQLHARNPGLVILRLTGFGQHGPKAEQRAFGTLAEAMSGFAHMTGEPSGPPTLPPFGLADGVAALAALGAVLMALRHRDQTGRGQAIDLSLLEPLLTILGPGPTAYDQLGLVPTRSGNRSPNNAPRNAYLTQDERWVVVSASAASVARRVMTLVGREDLTREPWFDSARERVSRADVLDSAVSRWIRDRDLATVEKEFAAAGAALAPVLDVKELMEDPQVRAMGAISTVHDPDLGPIRMQNVFCRMSQTPGSIRYAGRGLGVDTVAVLRDTFGIDEQRITSLQEQGAL